MRSERCLCDDMHRNPAYHCFFRNAEEYLWGRRCYSTARIVWCMPYEQGRLESALGQPFTFRPTNERRLLAAEADQALTSRECQFQAFRTS